ncbi:AAA family ATPase [Candidatus Marithrix sp. Canyon 246]|uniref:AAA family ATPase n=1 Tax=Candidatus Marithrix sp. Canyon 246 TaxID=1827136 RepID=UPI000849F960|nr:ATP-binding protein [Candidatus Marithrix sp. Canyon 246]
MTYIKKIEIRKLFGELDINWSLDPKVNILIGKNGSGKTTLLRLLKQTLKPSHGIALASGIESIRIELNDNKYISKDSDLVPPDVNLCYINTFDRYQPDNSKDHTELDVVLKPLINDWKSYLLKLKILAEKVTTEFDEQIRHISTKKTADDNDLQKLKQLLNDKTEQINDITNYKNRFIQQINALFSDSHKRIDFDKNNAIIFKNHNNQTFTVYELSAGEKQMLIILLNVLIQENQPSIILIDEPEISLHLAWQHKLIDIIQSLNDKCQLIIVTHAAGVFSKGWQDKITKMADIITEQS